MWRLWMQRLAAVFTPVVPPRFGYAICRILSLIYYLIDRRNRRHVLDNLSHIESVTGRFQRHRAALGVVMPVITNYYDLLRLRSADRNSILDLVVIHGQENLEEAVRTGKGVIVLSANLGNFSVVARNPALNGLDTTAITERVKPPELFDYLTRLRSAAGLDVASHGPGSVRPILQLLRRSGVLLLAGDRDVDGHDVTVPFFGEPAVLPAGPVLLAMRTGATLLPACTLRHSSERSFVAPFSRRFISPRWVPPRPTWR
jgi:lauroyl/myristoyl acyltransferase